MAGTGTELQWEELNILEEEGEIHEQWRQVRSYQLRDAHDLWVDNCR